MLALFTVWCEIHYWTLYLVELASLNGTETANSHTEKKTAIIHILRDLAPEVSFKRAVTVTDKIRQDPRWNSFFLQTVLLRLNKKKTYSVS